MLINDITDVSPRHPGIILPTANCRQILCKSDKRILTIVDDVYLMKMDILQ